MIEENEKKIKLVELLEKFKELTITKDKLIKTQNSYCEDVVEPTIINIGLLLDEISNHICTVLGIPRENYGGMKGMNKTDATYGCRRKDYIDQILEQYVFNDLHNATSLKITELITKTDKLNTLHKPAWDKIERLYLKLQRTPISNISKAIPIIKELSNKTTDKELIKWLYNDLNRYNSLLYDLSLEEILEVYLNKYASTKFYPLFNDKIIAFQTEIPSKKNIDKVKNLFYAHLGFDMQLIKNYVNKHFKQPHKILMQLKSEWEI